MADKEKYVGELAGFLSQSAREMEAVLHRLEWTKEKLLNEVWSGLFSNYM